MDEIFIIMFLTHSSEKVKTKCTKLLVERIAADFGVHGNRQTVPYGVQVSLPGGRTAQ